jgi:hypothetical protein
MHANWHQFSSSFFIFDQACITDYLAAFGAFLGINRNVHTDNTLHDTRYLFVVKDIFADYERLWFSAIPSI